MRNSLSFSYINFRNLKKYRITSHCDVRFTHNMKDAYYVKFNASKAKELIIFKNVYQYNVSLTDELLQECGIDPSTFLFYGTDKNFILTVDVQALQRNNLLPTGVNISERLLSKLEPFPFNEEVFLKDIRSKRNGPNSIKKIRNSIEKQYLSWKLNVDIPIIEHTVRKYKSCLYIGRSIQSVKRNLDLIMRSPATSGENFPNQIYLLNLKPCSTEVLSKFKNNLFGLHWDEIAVMFPNLIKRPYELIILLYETFKEAGFSEVQIKNGFSVLPHRSTSSILLKFYYVMNNPKFLQYRTSDKFLMLVAFSGSTLVMADNSKVDNFFNSKLQRPVSFRGKFFQKDLFYHVRKFINFDRKTVCDLCRHPNMSLVSFSQINETLKFLSSRFSEDEIMESIFIVLYPREEIERVLNKIRKNKEELSKLGFEKGTFSTETEIFSCGTKSKNKCLQLCLYYLEKPLSFTWKGVHLINDGDRIDE